MPASVTPKEARTQLRSQNGAAPLSRKEVGAVAAARNGRSPMPEVEAAPVPPEVAPAAATALTTPDGEAIDAREVAAALEGRSAQETIAWALETFGTGLSFACSFQKTTSVAVDIVDRLDAEARFFYLDTDVLFDESYATRDALEERYGIEFERFAGISLAEQADLYGDALWARQPDACCGIRKVEPMREALASVLAADWAEDITGDSDVTVAKERKARIAVAQARSDDGQEGTPDQFEANEWLDARL